MLKWSPLDKRRLLASMKNCIPTNRNGEERTKKVIPAIGDFLSMEGSVIEKGSHIARKNFLDFQNQDR